jgi:PD-(D/E)XK nuclease superfamily
MEQDVLGASRVTEMLPPRDYYSITQLRAFFSRGCNFVYYLRYVLGRKGPYSASAWLSWAIVKPMIQMAYYGIPLAEAHRRVWQATCSPILRDLQQWYALDCACQDSGRPNTKARERWVASHPSYAELAGSIEAYRARFLSEEYTWGKSTSLAAGYRWTCELVNLPAEQLILPHARFVRGQSLYDESGTLNERFTSDGQDDSVDHFRLLCGTVGHVRVCGVPDVIAITPQGEVQIADIKVMARPMDPQDVAEDDQLNLYLELCRQEGIISTEQPVTIGHLYCTERQGIVQVWAEPSDEALPRLSWQLSHMDRRIHEGDFLPVRGISTGPLAPCVTCEMAAACRQELRRLHHPNLS